VKGKPPRIPDDIRAVCREVLGLENLAIRKRLKGWFESGDGLGSTTFRHVMLMGYGQVKHAMVSGDQQRPTLIFTSTSGHVPWSPLAPGAAAMNARSEAMNRAKEQEGQLLALEAAAEKAPVVIDAKATAEDDPAAEVLEAVIPPPEDPGAHGGGGRGR
jgi:hypothetical protein